ncbi:aminodeoxychorismate lyase [Paenibacillus sp. GCM10012306]|uniref:aminodeoxychorismate lyase n=1 Tax=Paenibacillus sp. GCM10012306 TaxID=3317342 RepID=UPI003611938C
MKYIGINDGVFDAKEAVVSVLDHGFLYGIGLFETFRTYDGVPFLLDRHLKRLAAGCKELGIPFEQEEGRLLHWIKRVMDKNGLQEAYIRYTVTAGEDILGLPAGDYSQPNHLLYIKELPKRSNKLYTAGKPLQLLSHRRNTPEGTQRFKSLHYMNNILAKRELSKYASSTEGAEGLMLTADGHLSEGIVSNVFFVHHNVLYTPSLSTGILPGITREMVLELASSAGLRIEEGQYEWERLRTADEVFLTNSVQELVPVTTLWEQDERYIVGDGSCGEITGQLIHLYRERTGARQ